MSYLGDFRLGSTFDVKYNALVGGVLTVLTGTPTVGIYVGNSTTLITAGITLTSPFDSKTGLSNVRVVATAANGYLAGNNYTVVFTAGTLGINSLVGLILGEFSIENRSDLMSTTAGRTLNVDATGNVPATISDKAGYALSAAEESAIAAAVRTNIAIELARLDATISSRATQTSVATIPTTAAPAASAIVSAFGTGSTLTALAQDATVAKSSAVSGLATQIAAIPAATNDDALSRLDNYTATDTSLRIGTKLWTAIRDVKSRFLTSLRP